MHYETRSRSKLKILVWERNGFLLWYKRLERHRFHWPRVGDTVLTLSGAELNRLLDGYDVWMKPHGRTLKLPSWHELRQLTEAV